MTSCSATRTSATTHVMHTGVHGVGGRRELRPARTERDDAATHRPDRRRDARCERASESRRPPARSREPSRRPASVWSPSATRCRTGTSAAQRVQRYAESRGPRLATTARSRNGEEYEPHITSGTIIYAGVDYGAILEQAQAECDVLLWDGGNNDLPFYRPTVLDHAGRSARARDTSSATTPGRPTCGRPGRSSINKMDSATPEQVAQLEATIAEANPGAVVVKANSKVTCDDPEAVRGKRVLVVEDGPTLTHGEMKIGAGVVAAQRWARPRSSILVPGRSERSPRRSSEYDVGAVLPGDGLQRRPAGRDVEDHRRGRRRPRGDRHADRPAQGDRHPQARRAGALRPRRVARTRRSSPISWRRSCKGGSRGAGRRGPRRQRPASAAARRTRYEEMYRAARAAAERIAEIAADGWEVVVTHGNGPQVGRILIQQEAAAKQVHPMPLDVCGAESQGPDRLPPPGHDRRRLLRARDGTARRDDPVAHPRPSERPGVPQADEVRRAVLQRDPREEARRAARLGDEGRPARRMASRRAQPGAVPRSWRRP